MYTATSTTHVRRVFESRQAVNRGTNTVDLGDRIDRCAAEASESTAIRSCERSISAPVCPALDDDVEDESDRSGGGVMVRSRGESAPAVTGGESCWYDSAD